MTDHSEMRRIIRRTGILDVTEPVDLLRLQRATKEVIADNGRIRDKAGDPYRSPQIVHWFSGDATRKERAAQAGTGVLFSGWAETAPSSGNCVVSLTVNGVVVATLTILNGTSTAETSPALFIPTGAWIGGILTTPSGASNVSTSLTIDVGSGS